MNAQADHGPHRLSEVQRRRRRRGQRLEAVMGFLGFFVIVFAAVAVRAITAGEPSVLASGILIVLLGLLGWALRQRMRL